MIVCPHCGSTNRVAAGKALAEGKCGQCHELLFVGESASVDAASFERQISRSDVPVVVDFWADWCGPCHAMAPSFEAAARELEPRMRFVKLDTEAEPQVAARYDIRGIPNLIVFHKGKILAQQAGAMDARTLTGWLRQYVG
ncbi:thioredoxin TrxC [Devosia sp. CN2-171]|uniref:thioredoxin TrxC n=1 Tax=Devosia sp. CN2-171 TaxID=3400909 RepID=UPI003BF898B6